jgi:hypothetical protein
MQEQSKKVVPVSDYFDDDFIAGEKRPLIPTGIYRAQCISVKQIKYYGEARLRLVFKILEGESMDVELDMFLNLTDSKGKKFRVVPKASNYYKAWVIANNCCVPSRHDRMSPSKFLNGIFRVNVRDARPRNSDGSKMPEGLNYSVIGYLIKREI